MKTRFWFGAVLAISLLFATGAWAEDHDRFDDHDRQVTRDWHHEHLKHPARGLRDEDRLTPEQELRLERGREFDRDLRRHAHYIPRDLGRRLPPPPRHHVYVAIGGHVVLVDREHHVLRDVIHLHADIRP